MVAVYEGRELRDALRLKALLGRERVRRLVSGQHPLAAGFAALDKEVVGLSPLSLDEKYRLGDLKVVAETVFWQEANWISNRERFVGQLLKATECEALLFEVEVIRFAVAPKVQSIEWPIYRQAERDIRTLKPDMLIECKMMRSLDLHRLKRRLSKAKGQPRPDGIPFVVAVGFPGLHPTRRGQEIAALVREMTPWFGRHPEISAALFFTRMNPPRQAVRLDGLALQLRPFHVGDIVEVRNHGATDPLPLGFTFRW